MSTKKALHQSTDLGVEDILASASYHAVCLVGAADQAERCVRGVYSADEADVLWYPAESFGIGDAQYVRDWSLSKPLRSDRKLCCITTSGLTHEAQNALLKILEDPPGHAQYVLIIPTDDLLLPTLASRLAVISLDRSQTSGLDAAAFLKAPIVKRREFLAQAVEQRDRKILRQFLDELEELLASGGSRRGDVGSFLRSLPQLKRMLAEQQASLGQIAEHVTVFAPYSGRA